MHWGSALRYWSKFCRRVPAQRTVRAACQSWNNAQNNKSNAYRIARNCKLDAADHELSQFAPTDAPLAL
eukprot:1835858-Lingulodinium_polyedra.AAC.1